MDLNLLKNYTKNRYFPELDIKYKNESFFMKILSYILFFNKSFMTLYITTIGNTLYYPSEEFVQSRKFSSLVVFLHELMHIADSKKLNNIFYSFLYLLPISLIPFVLPLFIFNWWIPLIAIAICLIPFPAYFRMIFEKRGYMVSLYATKKLSDKLNYKTDLEVSKNTCLRNFKNANYYFMWIFPDIDKKFDDAFEKIIKGERPFEDPIFDIIDDLIYQIDPSILLS